MEREPAPNESDFEEWGWFSKEEIEERNFAADCKERTIDYFNFKDK